MVDEVMILEGADGDWRSRSRLFIIVILIDSSSQIVFYS